MAGDAEVPVLLIARGPEDVAGGGVDIRGGAAGLHGLQRRHGGVVDGGVDLLLLLTAGTARHDGAAVIAVVTVVAAAHVHQNEVTVSDDALRGEAD